MKKMVALVAVLAIIAPGFSVPVAVAQPAEKPNMFSNKDACEAALKSGNFRYYEPKYFGLKTRNLVYERDRVRVPLESDLCLQMQVVGGRRWVVQRESTIFRAYKLEDGSLSLYARDDCGNRVFGVVFPAPPPVAEVEPEPEPAPMHVAPVYGPPPPVVKRVVHREYEEPKGRRKWPWVLGALALGGGYATYYYWPCPPGTKRR